MARDTSFSYSFLVLPPASAAPSASVWDFCRAVDDAVDEAADPATAATEVVKWREEVGRLFGSEPPLTPQAQHLKPYVDAFALSRQPFDDLVDGVEMDLRRSRYDTFDELVGYCRRVASAVGVMCIEVFGCRDSRSRDYAFNLGLALQITNIIRDVKADLETGPRLPAAGGSRALRRHASRTLAAGVVTEPISEAAGARVPARAAVLRRGRAGHAACRIAQAGRGRDHGRRSTSRSFSASSGAATTCSASGSACRSCSARGSRCRSGRCRSCPHSA